MDTQQSLAEAINTIYGATLKKVSSVHMTKVLFKLLEKDREKQHIQNYFEEGWTKKRKFSHLPFLFGSETAGSLGINWF